MIVNFDKETTFPRKILLSATQLANLRKSFGNYLSTDNKLSKTLLSKII